MAKFSVYQIFKAVTNIVTSLVIVILFVLFESVISPFNRGFFCDDDSIKMPYKSKQTVSTSVLVVVSIALLAVTIIACDLLNFLQAKRNNRLAKDDISPVEVCSCIKLKGVIYRSIARFCICGCGFLMCMIVTGLAKRMVGRLRPHFLDVCKPDYSSFNCSAGYISFDVCTGTNAKALKEARVSFPSGHASASMFASVFVAFYIQYTIRPPRFLLLKPFMQFIAICLALACGFSRVSDYFHHWSDVLAGFILGLLMAIYTIYVLLELPKCEAELTSHRVPNVSQNIDIEAHQINTENTAYGSCSTDEKNS